MRYHVMSVNGALSEQLHSHRAAWVRMRAEQEHARGNELILYSDWEKIPFDGFQASEDRVLVYLGMEWSGGLNLFGGTSDENAKKLGWPAKASEIVFLDERADIPGLMAQRKVESSSLWYKVMMNPTIRYRYETGSILEQPRLDSVIAGDSHSLSWFERADQNVYRHDGKTLYGALSNNLMSLYGERDVSDISFVLGSIDCRHHLARQKDPLGSTVELARDYAKTLKWVRKESPRLKTLRVAEMIPIEDESRPMAKTGYYKGTPFFGDWELRDQIRQTFNDCLYKLELSGIVDEVLRYPKYLFTSDGKMNQDYMEKPRGVHLSWDHSAFRRELRYEADLVGADL